MIEISKLLDEWEKDSPINQDRLDHESIRIPQLHSKYMRILVAMRQVLRKKRSKLETLNADKKQWVQGRMTKDEIDARGWKHDPFDNYAKPLKSEMDAFIKVDPEVQKLRDDIKDLEILVEAVVDILSSITWRHQNIRNAIDWQRFQAGG